MARSNLQAVNRRRAHSVTNDKLYLAQLLDPDVDLHRVLAICREAGSEVPLWSRSPPLTCRLAELLLAFGDPIRAYDVLTEPLHEQGDVDEGQPEDLRVQQLRGLALARCGSTRHAHKLINTLYDGGQRDAETRGILARIHRDHALAASKAKDRKWYLEQAFALYLGAHKDEPKLAWPGLYAAIMALLSNDWPTALRIAEQVEKHCLEVFRREGNRKADSYWVFSNLGLAAVLQKRISDAAGWFRLAADVAKGRYGNLATTRSYLRLMASPLGLGADLARLDAAIDIPNVVMFVGHMIDRPGRAVPRFPPELEKRVAEEIARRLKLLRASVGFSSGTSGSDILFLEAMQRGGHETHIVLPYREDLFIEDSIRVKDNEHWVRRFHDVKRDASEVITATQQRLALGGVSYTYGNRVLHGLALIKARQLQTDLKYLAVWNGVPGDGPGGTADVIAEWEKQGRPIEIIDLKELLVRFAASKVVSGDGHSPARANRSNLAAGRTVTRSTPDKENVRGLIAAILFADVANFSKLNEDQIVHFVDHFLGLVHRVAKATVSKEQRRRGKTGKSPILKKNTWGDGLYFAFDSVRVAGLFALDLSDEVEGTKWSEKYHLPPLRIRIGLHAGPVFFCKDPLLGWNCMGTHVSHGARIEPITPKGEVYASREFAALTEAEMVKEFSCHYAGEREYAKKYGVFPIYYLERS